VNTIHVRGGASAFVRALFAVIVILGGFGAVSTHAQNSGSLSGSVQDAQKAQIGGAKVTVTRTETGVTAATTTDNSGFYSFSLLLPGHYNIAVERDGFSPQVREGVQIFTGQATSAGFALVVGQVVEKVEVSSDVAQLQTTTSSVSSVIENKTVTNFPLLDRRATQLQRLSGFVIGGGTGSGSSFAVAGGRGANANYTVDGGTVQNLLQGVPTQMFDLPVDAMQEFTFGISNYAAELGRSGGGYIQLTTKSGTNQFHGSGYFYYRSDALQAIPWFAPVNPLTGKQVNPSLDYNLYGGSFGGPVKRGRTYFFFSYEGRKQTQSSTVTASVPSALERSGDFSEIATPIVDPNTGEQAEYNGKLNVLPPSELDPYGVKLASYYPLPNVAGAAINTSNFIANDPAAYLGNVYVARIDHRFTDHDSVYGRFLAQPDHTDTADIFPTRGTDSWGVLSHGYYYNPSATWMHVFNSSLVNEARATFSFRQALSISHGVSSQAATDLALPGTNPIFFPTAVVQGLTAVGNTSQQRRLQTPILSNNYQDNLSWLRSNHQLKFGFEYRTSANNDYYSPSGGGSFTFTPQGISTNTAAGSLASLLLGRVNAATRLETEALYTEAKSLGVYAQDDWHVNGKFTINYGLRWDVDSPRYERNNRQNGFDLTAINPVSNTPGIITFSGRNGASRYANDFDLVLFGPRLGVAWTPDQRDVFHAGGGILYTGEYDQATPIVLNVGFSNTISLTSPNSVAGTPAFLLKNNGTDGTGKAAFPTPGQLTSGFGAVPVGGKTYVAPQFIARDHRTGYLFQIHADWQHEFSGNTLLNLAYSGTFGHRLASPFAESINEITPDKLAELRANPSAYKPQTLRPFPQFSNVQNLYPDDGQSGYNAGNAQIQKRYSRGFQYQINYTWSKFIDNSPSRFELAGFSSSTTFTSYYDQKARWGLSGNDVRHRLIASGLYELPFGRGRLLHSSSNWVNQVIGGWSTSGLVEIHSGTALSVYDATNNTGSYSDGVRPNLVGDPTSLPRGRTKDQMVAQWFNTAAFEQNPAYTFGNAPRTFGRGPGLFTADLTATKNVTLHDRHTFELRAEAFNAFNHANFGNPNTQFGTGSFGKIIGLQSGTTGSRVLQLAGHYTF
jgi:Carboxypeptidase regulatory-like domain